MKINTIIYFYVYISMLLIKTGCDALCCSRQHVCYINEYNCLILYLYGNGSLLVLFLIITYDDSNNWYNVEEMCNG